MFRCILPMVFPKISQNLQENVNHGDFFHQVVGVVVGLHRGFFPGSFTLFQTANEHLVTAASVQFNPFVPNVPFLYTLKTSVMMSHFT